MKNTIKCKKCGNEIEVSEALSHQIEEQIRSSVEVKHREELMIVKDKAKNEAIRKINKEFEVQFKNISKEKDEEKDRNNKLLKELDELLGEVRNLKRKDQERELEMKKKLSNEEEKIRIDAKKKADEEHQLKELEKDKKLHDALRQIEELKSKIQQGSQQLQGEVLELELERILKSEFPSDILKEVKKGERGADIIQVVIDKLRRECGMILWESKNAKWQNDWIPKLKEDKRSKKAELSVLVTINKPEWLTSFTYKDGVWICTLESVVSLAFALRFNLISIHHERASGEGKNEKMEILYKYLMGTEFRNRVESIVEAFGSLQDELEREKRWFSVKWSRQEKEIRKVLDSTHGMYGDLQGIIGKSLPEIKTLGIVDEIEDESGQTKTE